MTAKTVSLLILMGQLVGAIVLISVMSKPSHQASFASAMEFWADEVRDADGIGQQLIRVSASKETVFGDKAAREILAANPVRPAQENYVTRVGQSVALNALRKGITYHFHVIESSEINAFALPGGQIFVTTGMLNFIQSEAELAAVLGHEISHVDLRHCVSRYQYQLALGSEGPGAIAEVADLARSPLIAAYSKYEESEADVQGVTFAFEAGYDPRAMVDLLTRLEHYSPDPKPSARSAGPLDEVMQASTDAYVVYSRSHPLDRERIADLARLLARDADRLGQRNVYEGIENYRRQVPMEERKYPGESKVW
ncbi:MAG TPA: M48 family metalloprotease [Candidatus Binataceae bacterium]|nr:M48 family metalloprotease [Candidatus Binataceae bacterium]